MSFKTVPFLDQRDQYLRADSAEMQEILAILGDIRDTHDLQIRLPASAPLDRSKTQPFTGNR